MKLRTINLDDLDLYTLYELLGERTITQSISHKKMPTYGEHVAFVKSEPYKAWYLICDDSEIVGSVYLTHANELGIFIFKRAQGHGYAIQALMEIMSQFKGPFLANINPDNLDSKALFLGLGFKMIQVTYAK